MDLQLESCVESIVRRFARRDPRLDPEELRSEAWLCAAIALSQLHDGIENPAGWISFRVRQLLLNEVKNTASRMRLCKPGTNWPQLARSGPSCFSLERLLFDVSEDAARVIKASLRCLPGGRAAVRRHLKDTGWSMKRIMDAWLEVRESL